MSTKHLTQTAAALAALAAVALPLSAGAAIMYTPWQSADTGGLQGTTGSTTTLTFDQYDSADWGGAELHNVEFLLDTTGYATYRFVDASGAPNTFTFNAAMTVKVDGAGVSDLIVALPNLVDDEQTVPAGGEYQSSGWEFDFPNGLTDTDSASATYVGITLTPAIVALFSGAGTVDLFSSATIANNTSSTGDNDTFLRSRYEASLMVRYSYEVEDVPEPSSMLLFGAGMLGAAAAARRRKKAA